MALCWAWPDGLRPNFIPRVRESAAHAVGMCTASACDYVVVCHTYLCTGKSEKCLGCMDLANKIQALGVST